MHRPLKMRLLLILAVILVSASWAHAADPGQPVPTSALVSDQKPGSVLVYNIYRSGFNNATVVEDTEINLINTHTTVAITVRLFLINGATGTVRNEAVCLGPNQAASFLASQLDPGGAGYIVAVAVNTVTGCPVSHNFLTGDAYLKLVTGHEGKLNAVSIAANFSGAMPGCAAGAPLATLLFDGSANGYNRLPRVLALNSFPSRADANDTLLVVNRVGGNLSSGAATIGLVSGKLLDDQGYELEFTASLNAPQFRSSLTNNFPPTDLPIEIFIPAGLSGWLKLWANSDVGLLGAAFNFNPNLFRAAGAFTGGQNLHQLTLATSSSLAIPVGPQACANRPLLLSLSPGAVLPGNQSLSLTVRGQGFANGATVRWNGASRATNFISPAQLTATIPATDLASGGLAEITVINTSSGPPSNALKFFVASVACSYSLSAASQSFGANGGTGSVTVSTSSGCGWTAQSNAGWIAISSGAAGTGNGTVNFSVTPNSDLARTGTLTIAGKTFTVTQAGTIIELAVDDGVFDTSIGLTNGGTSYFLNRLTPSSYPATLNAVAIYFTADSGVKAGAAMTVVAGGNSTGGTNINGVSFQEASTTIQSLGKFDVYSVSPLTITSGDFVVGMRITYAKDVGPMSLDRTPPSQRRSYTGTSLGNFSLIDDLAPSLAGNFGIRARLTTAVASNPVPALSSLSPNTTVAGGANFTLTVNGAGFINSSVVRWNGGNRTTTFVSGTQLRATINAADIASAGTASVTVFNSTPGGGVSNTLGFSVTGGSNPQPEVEPNETLDQANPVALPSTRTGNAGVGDLTGIVITYNDGSEDGIEDLFAITLNAPSRLSLRLEFTSFPSDLDLFLIRESGGVLSIVAASAQDGSAPEQIVTSSALAAGRYFIGVSAFAGSSSYVLTVKNPDASFILPATLDAGALDGKTDKGGSRGRILTIRLAAPADPVSPASRGKNRRHR